MILLGKGKAWLDDASFEDLGRPVVRAEPARPLTARGLENLVAFTRLLGYVRHFHPSDEAAAADWDTFAIEGVSVAEGAKGAQLSVLRPEPRPSFNGRRYVTPQLVVDLSYSRCNDPASGRGYAHQVMVIAGGRTVRGCGGERQPQWDRKISA